MTTPSRPTLLVLDYPGRRDEARVRDLRLEEHGFDVRYLLGPPFQRAVTAAAYADELIEAHGPFEAVAGLLSYCMAAPIAQHVAARLSAGTSPIPMVTFDGEPATAAALDDQYGVTVAQLAAELGAALPRVDPIDAETLANDPTSVVAAMRSGLTKLATIALADDEDEDDAADDDSLADTVDGLTGFYLDWLVHLVAASNATWPRWGGEVLNVASRDHGYTGDWPGAAGTKLMRVDVSRPELLAQDTVGPPVVSFLNSTMSRQSTVRGGKP